MINNLGQWEANENYKTYPKEEWCDLDYVAAWIMQQEYKPKAPITRLTEIIVGHYDFAIKESGYFAIEDTRKYPDNLMINISDVEEYIRNSGGLEEFDYES